MVFGLKSILGSGKKGQIKHKWAFDSKEKLAAAPVTADLSGKGKKEIIFGTTDGKVYCLDKEGNTNWVFDASNNIKPEEIMFYDLDSANSIQSRPTIHDLAGNGKKQVLFGSEMGLVYALNSEGKELWNFKTNGSIRGEIIVRDIDRDGKNEIIFGSGDGNIYVLNIKGELKKTYEIGCNIESTPEVIGGRLIFGCDNGMIYCLDYSGKEEWTFKADGKIVAQPTYGRVFGDAKEYIAIGSIDHYMYLLDLEGEMVWKYKTEGAIYGKAQLADINKDHKLEIVFGSCDNNIYALEANGDKLWSYETDFWIVAPVIIDDIDHDGELEIIAGSYDHNVYILDAKGNYMLDYVPGLAGIMHQAGAYTDVVTAEPGNLSGKKLWQYQTEGVVVGCAVIEETKTIIVNVKTGKVNDLEHN